MDNHRRTRSRSRVKRTRPTAQPRKVAWVFAGGGPRGAFQAGAVKALDEAGIYPDRILGAGTGAINVCLYGTGGPAHMEECWLDFDGRRLLPSLSLRHNPLLGRSLASPQWLHRRVEMHVDFDYLLASSTDTGFAALNLSEGRVEVLDNRRARSPEELRQMARAAYAVPILYPPVAIGEDQYVLGGLSGRDLIAHAVAQDATEIYLLQCFTRTLPRAESLASLLEVAGRLGEVAYARIANYALEREQRDALRQRGVTVTIVEPAVNLARPSLFRRRYVRPTYTETLLEAGYTQAGAALRRQQRHSARKIVPLHGTRS